MCHIPNNCDVFNLQAELQILSYANEQVLQHNSFISPEITPNVLGEMSQYATYSMLHTRIFAKRGGFNNTEVINTLLVVKRVQKLHSLFPQLHLVQSSHYSSMLENNFLFVSEVLKNWMCGYSSTSSTQ